MFKIYSIIYWGFIQAHFNKPATEIQTVVDQCHATGTWTMPGQIRTIIGICVIYHGFPHWGGCQNVCYLMRNYKQSTNSWLILDFHPAHKRWHYNVMPSLIGWAQAMKMSSNGSIFRVTGPLRWELTGHRWIPAQRPVTWSFDVFSDLHLNKRLSEQLWGWWFETLSHSLWSHYNARVSHNVSHWLGASLKSTLKMHCNVCIRELGHWRFR